MLLHEGHFFALTVALLPMGVRCRAAELMWRSMNLLEFTRLGLLCEVRHLPNSGMKWDAIGRQKWESFDAYDRITNGRQDVAQAHIRPRVQVHLCGRLIDCSTLLTEPGNATPQGL
jgi:hypothetical protein